MLLLPHVDNPLLWHQLFEVSAILIGVQFYRWRKREGGGLLSRKQFPIVLGALLGAGIGNKAVFWLERVDLWPLFATNLQTWFMGQSMVGGLLGGWIGVECAKYFTHQKQSTGDAFVYPILLALIIGRVGCFVAGLSDGTYGNPTNFPWAVDFGDGIARHPTQLYEIVFAILLWCVLAKWQLRLSTVSGLQFKLMLSAYLVWRLIVDFIKPVPFEWIGGLSGIQVVCVIALIGYLPMVWRDSKKIIKKGCLE
jgi:prolipoprotein diacylglyceryltransferase